MDELLMNFSALNWILLFYRIVFFRIFFFQFSKQSLVAVSFFLVWISISSFFNFQRWTIAWKGLSCFFGIQLSNEFWTSKLIWISTFFIICHKMFMVHHFSSCLFSHKLYRFWFLLWIILAWFWTLLLDVCIALKRVSFFIWSFTFLMSESCMSLKTEIQRLYKCNILAEIATKRLVAHFTMQIFFVFVQNVDTLFHLNFPKKFMLQPWYSHMPYFLVSLQPL